MSKNSKNNLAGQPILSQLLTFIPEEIIRESVKKYKADRYFKSFRTKDQLICMVYAVLTKCSSIREVCKNILFMGSKLIYCGLTHPPKRSTFSDANANRSDEVFGEIYFRLYGHYQSYLSKSFISGLINGEIDPARVEIFDSSTVTLFKEIFKGAGRNSLNGKKKGGIKVHTQATLTDMTPHFICFSDGASNDKNFLQMMKLPENSIGVFDKGFHNFSKYREWNENNRFYVTRANDNIHFKTVKELPLEEKSEVGVVSDRIIELTYWCKQEKAKKTVKARLVAYIDPVKGERLAFLTNQFDSKATTICRLYINRWAIEVVFKQLKQNFELKYFLSDSQNGIKTQIWVALILNLIFEVIHKMIKEAEDFATMVKIAAKNLCSYVSYINFLKNPFSEWIKIKKEELEKMQLDLFDDKIGGVFQNSA